jgi:hypothetical protein
MPEPTRYYRHKKLKLKAEISQYVDQGVVLEIWYERGYEIHVLSLEEFERNWTEDFSERPWS